MRTSFFIFSLATLFLLSGTATAQKCGLEIAHQNRIKAAADPKGYAAKRINFARSNEYCEPEAYYDSVYSRETEHFQIFYTLGNNPHATFPEFIDSLAVALEDAYNFHTKTMGMRAPLGLDSTSHYIMHVKKGLYPVEVAEIDFLRDPLRVLGSAQCNGCYGITYPDLEDFHKSAIIIDNDFKFVPELSQTTSYIEKDGKTCSYPVSSETQYNKAHGFSYGDNWAKGIRITAFHELYHSIQLRYISLFEHWTYWIEPSATANEEIGVPSVDDYFVYISSFFSDLVRDPIYSLRSKGGPYGLNVLYLYLYKNVDKHFDREIWENFEKSPDMEFHNNLEKVLKKRDLSADSVFHDFATRLAFSGENTKTVDKKLWIWEDQPRWSAPVVKSGLYYNSYGKESPFYSGKDSYNDNRFEPDTALYSIRYYVNGEPNLEYFRGNASALIFKGNKTEIRKIANTGTIDAINKESFTADSIMWVFSRFATPKHIPEVLKDSTLRAYPVPWRGSGPLCFTPLPDTKSFIEIRSGRGELIMREQYTKTTHCISEDQIKGKLKPGVYRFRVGSSGKLQKFMVVY